MLHGPSPVGFPCWQQKKAVRQFWSTRVSVPFAGPAEMDDCSIVEAGAGLQPVNLLIGSKRAQPSLLKNTFFTPCGDEFWSNHLECHAAFDDDVKHMNNRARLHVPREDCRATFKHLQ
jgi:hypothetical protein